MPCDGGGIRRARAPVPGHRARGMGRANERPQERGRGTNVDAFGADGRIESVTGFWAQEGSEAIP